MEERKSMGSALVDVFDAGVVLVKSEINALVKKVSELAKAKGIGIVLLLAALGPLLLGLIFLILAVFYGLMRLGLAAWAAALIIALVSLAITGALIALGISKLSAEVDTGMPRRPVNMGSPEFGASASSAAHGVPATDLRYDVPAAGRAAPVAATTYYSEPVKTVSHDHHDHHNDPNLQNPVVMRDAPGIAVSTRPTYVEDMQREGLDVPATAQHDSLNKGGH